MRVLEQWRTFATTHEASLLRAILHPDIVFESPIVHSPQAGAEIAAKYLESAVLVLGNEKFRYLGEWRNRQGAVLEFATEIDGIQINGVDIITATEDEAMIARFKVMIRPLKAINLVHRLMRERLEHA